MVCLAEILWGSNPKVRDFAEALGRKTGPTRDEARKILAAVVHPEIMNVINKIEEQMTDGREIARYEIKDAYVATFGTFLFSEGSYRDGTYNLIQNMIQSAHPEYEAVSCGLGEMNFRKRAT